MLFLGTYFYLSGQNCYVNLEISLYHWNLSGNLSSYQTVLYNRNFYLVTKNYQTFIKVLSEFYQGKIQHREKNRSIPYYLNHAELPMTRWTKIESRWRKTVVSVCHKNNVQFLAVQIDTLDVEMLKSKELCKLDDGSTKPVLILWQYGHFGPRFY